VVDNSIGFNSQNFLLLLLISEQLRYEIGGAVPFVKEFAGTLLPSGLTRQPPLNA